MIDTDKYEWDSKCRLVVIDGELFQRGANGDYHISQQLHDKAVAQIVADAPLLLEEVKRLREAIEYDDLKKLQKMYASSMEERRLLREEVKRLSKITEYVKGTFDYHYHCIDNMTGGFIDWMVFATELHDMFYGDEEE